MSWTKNYKECPLYIMNNGKCRYSRQKCTEVVEYRSCSSWVLKIKNAKKTGEKKTISLV